MGEFGQALGVHLRILQFSLLGGFINLAIDLVQDLVGGVDVRICARLTEALFAQSAAGTVKRRVFGIDGRAGHMA